MKIKFQFYGLNRPAEIAHYVRTLLGAQMITHAGHPLISPSIYTYDSAQARLSKQVSSLPEAVQAEASYKCKA